MKYLKLFLGGLNSVIGYLLGGLDAMLICLFTFMILDYVTGIIKAFKNKKLSSETGFYGILKKITILVVIMVAVQVDTALQLNDVMRYLAIGFYIANEGLSILENAGEIGIPLPDKLKESLESLRSDEDV